MIDLVFSTEVSAAQSQGRPIVALESTIITHGMPAPRNVEVARKVEDIIRAEGAVPATIAVLQGSLHIGLEALDDLRSDLEAGLKRLREAS